MRATNTFRALCLGALLGLSGCMTVHHDHEYGRYDGYEDDYGPPAYGPRYHHYGVDHLYNVQLGVYTVVGYPHTYWHDGSYWRHSNGYWERCARPRGGHWSRADWQHVPHRLRPRYGDSRGDHHDRWDRRDVRKHERNEHAEQRRERNEHAVQPRVQREENRQDRHARTEPRHDPLDARKELKHDQESERKAQRHELGEGRHDRRDAGWQVRHERAEQRHDPLDARKDLKRDQHKVERHERKNERRQEQHENRDAHDRYAREQGSE